MERELAAYARYKRNITLQLGCSGVWPGTLTLPRYLRKFLSLLSALVSALSFYAVFVFCLRHATSVTTWARGLGLLIGLFSAAFKVCVLSSHEKDLQSLNDGISASFERNLKEPPSRPQLLAHFSSFNRFFNLHSYLGGLSASLLVLTPLVLLRKGKYARVFPYHLPFSYEPGGLVHWLLYGFEALSGFYLWSVNSGTDCVFGLYALHMVGELRLLGKRFRSLKSGPNYTRELKQCIISHHLLLESRRLLERVFGLLAICLTVTCAVALCALVFQATEIRRMTTIRVCYLIGHSLIKLVQAFSYAWYGNILAVESENCLMSIYDAYWPGSGDKKFMKDIFLVLLQKPLVFRAKGLMFLRLDTFLKIVNTSVSYFFLLQTLEEKSL